MRWGMLNGGLAIAIFLFVFKLWAGPEASSTSSRVELSEEQRKWLEQQKTLRVGITPEWAPFSYFTDDGKGAGIDVDVLNLIAERTGLKYELIPATPWEKMLKMAAEGKLDVTTTTVQTAEREKIFKFTRPYAESGTVIVAREGETRFRHLLQLRSATVALPSSHAVTKAFQERVPEAKVILQKTQGECYELVHNKQADVAVCDMYTAAQYLNNHPRAKLSIIGVIPEFTFPLRMAVRHEFPIAVEILDLGLASISQGEMDAIVSRHLAFQLEGAERSILQRKRIIYVLSVGIVVAALLYAWNLRIRREVRARRAAEEALRETNRSLEVFAHAVSHDLKTPLRAIRGLSEALREDYTSTLNSVGSDYIERIIAAADRMDGLIAGVLAYSDASSPNLPLQRVPVKQLVEQLVQEFPVPRRQFLRIVSDLPDVWANPGLLGQCIGNLISNALKFIPEGRTPDVRISGERIGPMVKLIVEDNGIGVADEDRERIFQLFQRVGTGGFSGSGIGLAVVAKGVLRMGGSVGVESKIGEGSRFWIQLPGVVQGEGLTSHAR